MTKKDYELFANQFYETKKYKQFEHWTDQEVVYLLARVFSIDNPLFKLDKFERACYEGKHIRQSIKNG